MIIKWKPEVRARLIDEIQHFFATEREEEIGIVAAGEVLAFVDEQLASYYYNEGVHHAMRAASEQTNRLEEEMYALLRPIE